MEPKNHLFEKEIHLKHPPPWLWVIFQGVIKSHQIPEIENKERSQLCSPKGRTHWLCFDPESQSKVNNWWFISWSFSYHFFRDSEPNIYFMIRYIFIHIYIYIDMVTSPKIYLSHFFSIGSTSTLVSPVRCSFFFPGPCNESRLLLSHRDPPIHHGKILMPPYPPEPTYPPV